MNTRVEQAESGNTSSVSVPDGHGDGGGFDARGGADGRTVARICEHCRASFTTFRYQVARARGRFCSRSCASLAIVKAHPRFPLFGPANPNWKGGISANNYVYALRFRAKHPEKVAAHAAVAKAVLNGSLVRPVACEDCDVPCRAHGHHDDYTKLLAVRWLCRRCHRVADQWRRIREQLADRRLKGAAKRRAFPRAVSA